MSCLGVERGREGSQVLRAPYFKTGGDLNEECCTAVFHAAQRKLNSSLKGEAGTCFQQKCLFILEWNPSGRDSRTGPWDKSRVKALLARLSSASTGHTGSRPMGQQCPSAVQDEGCRTPLCFGPASFISWYHPWVGSTESSQEDHTLLKEARKNKGKKPSRQNYILKPPGSRRCRIILHPIILQLASTSPMHYINGKNTLKKYIVKCRITSTILGFSSDATEDREGWLPRFCSVEAEAALVYAISYLTREVKRNFLLLTSVALLKALVPSSSQATLGTCSATASSYCPSRTTDFHSKHSHSFNN